MATPKTRTPLPIDAVLPQLLDAWRTGPSVVLQAPPGAGKTTRVPLALLDAGLAGSGRTFILEPRRLAARAAARRMAGERGQRIGQDVGYHVRFDKQWNESTRIVAVTPGILLRMLHDDPFLESASTIIFDEFHERGLESDLALGAVRLIQQNVRPELRVVVMSATLETDAVAHYLGDCPIVTGTGRTYPVELRYEPRSDEQPWSAAITGAVERVLDTTDGDILVFLAGWNEIRQTARELEPLARECDLAVLPLHGELTAEEQDAALLPQSRRKVVLATNVAETSVTVGGVTAVIDTGLARQLTYDAAIGLDRLGLTPISQASAEQRAGRAGRTGPGICVRLWSELSQRARAPRTEPEIRRVDLTGAVLHVLALGERDVRRFPWLEPPKDAAVDQAFMLLRRLGALDDMGLTKLGRALARIPVHPRLARLLVEGQRVQDTKRTALAAALLAERDPFLRSRTGVQVPATFSDLVDCVEALEEFERSGRETTRHGSLNAGAARFLLRARDQFLQSLRTESPPPTVQIDHHQSEVLPQALLAAYPDRLARRRRPCDSRGVMVGGRGVRLAPLSGVVEPELFLCLDVDAGDNEAWVRQASGVRREWLVDRLVSAVDVEFDPATERVVARKRLTYEDLIVEESPATPPDNDVTARLLADVAAKNLERVMPSSDSAAASFLTRARCLTQWLPELGLPVFNDAALCSLLPALCQGCRSFDDLRQADWLGALQGRLTYSQHQAIEREAPERIQVPSGACIVLSYQLGRAPVLAVRIQELFGMKETPRIANGRIRVLLHLLAPNFRAQQVTDDLASFWINTYPQVRKDLRARYPKHAWPEDPLFAAPTRGPKKRQ